MDIEQSLDRIHQSDKMFGQRFYAELGVRLPEAASLFEGVNMDHQGALFTMQLAAMVAYYRHRSPAPGLYLQVLGTRHKDRGVPVEWYSQFCEILLDVLATFLQDHWDESLEDAWRSAIRDAAEKMLEGYDQRYHV